MDQGRKSKRALPKPTIMDPTEARVCGTGRSRVINVNPLLLTPSSVSKIYAGRQGKSRHGVRCKQSPGGSQYPFRTQSSYERGDYKSQSGNASDADLSSSGVAMSSSFYSKSNGLGIRHLSASASIAGSELSLSSGITADDVSSIADSEVTDISEYASGYERSFSDATLQSNSLQFTSVVALSQVDHNSLTPNSEHFNEYISYGDSSSLDHSSTTQIIQLNSDGSPPESKPDHGHKWHDADLLQGKPVQSTPMNKQQNQPLKGRAKRERVIEISPSLMLPVSSVGVNDLRAPEKEGVTSYSNDMIGVYRESHSQNVDPVPFQHSSEGSILQTEENQREGVAASSVNGDSIVLEPDGEIKTDLASTVKICNECANLRQSLKLADADIAILVSSKQQLQLKFHEAKEKNNALSRIQNTLEEKNTEITTKCEELESLIMELKKANEVALAENRGQLQKLQESHEGTLQTLEITKSERDSKVQELGNLKHTMEANKMQLLRMQEELQDVTTKNIKLETLVQEASSEGEGNKVYMSHLNQERSDMAKKIQELEQQDTMYQIKDKAQESKIVDLQDTNKELREKVTKLERRSREYEAENYILTSRLQTAAKEKTDLDIAVVRLRSDLSKVETSFSRLKQQMIEKSKLAEKEAARREELEAKCKVLSENANKLMDLNPETRIRDKNVQIEQLLTKSKISMIEKSRMERTVEKLQAHIDANEKSWTEAVQREKHTKKQLEEKEELCNEITREKENLSHRLKAETEKVESLSNSLKTSEIHAVELDSKLKKAEQTLDKVMEENNSIATAMEILKKQFHEQEEKSVRDRMNHKEEASQLRNDISELNTQVEGLQMAVVSKKEELRSLKSVDFSLNEPDPNAIQQMEMLSELQSARRKLSHEKDALLEENRVLKLKQDELERNLVMAKKQEKKKLDSVQAEMDKLIKSLKDDISLKVKKLDETGKLRCHLEEEMLIIKDHNNALSQQLGALQNHNHKLSGDLQSKIKDFEEAKNQCNRIQEESKMLKQELSSVTLQLSESLQANIQLVGASDMENVIKERDLLKDAVMRQQQYAASLQKHYEKWAKDAGAKMKDEVAKVRIAAEEERNRVMQERIEHKKMLQEMEGKIIDKTMPRKFADVGTQMEKYAMENSWTQTDHNKDQLRPWSQEEVMTSRRDIDSKIADDLDKNENILQADTESLIKERDMLKDALLRQQQHATSLQQHYEKWAQDAGDKMMKEVTNTRLNMENEKLVLQQENLKQAEVIKALKEKLSDITYSGEHSIDAGIQTSHDDTALSGSLLPEPLQVAVGDSSSQTDHDSEEITPTSKEMLSRYKKEIEEMEFFTEKEKCKNMVLQEKILQLEEAMSKLSSSKNCDTSTSATQTSHDETNISLLSHASQAIEVASLLEDASSQTDHDTDPISPRPEDAKRMVEEVMSLKMIVEEEKSLLMQKNMKLKNKIAEMEKEITDKLNRQNSSSTQTSQDSTPTPSSNSVHRSSEDSSTQTDHDARQLTPQKDVYQQNEEVSNVMQIREEEKNHLLEENSRQTEEVAALKEIIRNFTTSHSDLLLDVGTQTNHEEAPIYTGSSLNSLEVSPLLEDHATQTDHDTDGCHQDANRLLEILMATEEERDRFKWKIEEQAIYLKSLEERTKEYEAQLARQSGDDKKQKTQMLLLKSGPDIQPKLTEESWTQTARDEELIVPWSREADSMMLEEICTVRKFAEEEIDRLSKEKAMQAEEMAELREKLKDSFTNKYRYATTSTQTSHEETPLYLLSDLSTSNDLNQAKHSDSSAQTSHDLDPVVVSWSQDFALAQAKEELKVSKQQILDVDRRLHEALSDNRRLTVILKERSNVKISHSGTQTSQVEDHICLHAGPMRSAEVRTSAASTQTQPGPGQTSATLPQTLSRTLSVSRKHINVQVLHKAQVSHDDSSGGICQKCQMFQPDENRSVAAQTDITVNMESNEEGCPACGQAQDGIQLPSPMTILRTMESRKLKAYKKTVHLLKKKLQSAEDKINDLQAELNMLSPSSPNVFTENDELSKPLPDDEQELFEQNSKAMAEIKLLQQEIFEMRKSSALQAEDARRKALGEKKKLEAKVTNMSERVAALTDTNKRLRDSVEKLQVKLAEKTKVGDIAQKEKQRYQLRARRLQASLRSLAWITGKQETLSPPGECDSEIQEEDMTLNEATNDVSYGDAEIKRKSSTDRAVLSLPASVIEIEESLKDLQSEIIALERQMQEHNSAVKKSKSQWSRLKEQSNQDLGSPPEEEEESQRNENLPAAADHIDQISHMI